MSPMENLEVFSRLRFLTQNVNTFLSSYVKGIVINKEIVKDIVLPNRCEIVEDVFASTWDRIEHILLNDDAGKFQPCSFVHEAEWCIRKIEHLAPLFNKIKHTILNASENEINQLTKWCLWIQEPDTIQLCFHFLLHCNLPEFNVNLLECILLLTAALERALGNLFLLKCQNKMVPHLLRDLLSSEELQIVLGDVQVLFIQLLMGSPLSLNLRNLAWHGFLGYDELPTDYSYVLMFVICSIGRRLSIQDITNDSIPQRPWISFYQSCVLQGLFPVLDKEKKQHDLENVVMASSTIPESMKPLWIQAIGHYYKGYYGRCLCLLLPQLEHVLRLIFVAVHDCPNRALTAESTVLYTTLDVILDGSYRKEPEGKPEVNRMREFLGKNLYLALRDIFVEMEGPRIRDRISHGQCKLADADALACNHVLSLSLAVLLKSEGTLYNETREKGHFVNLTVNWHALFHPVSLFKQELENAFIGIENWMNAPKMQEKLTSTNDLNAVSRLSYFDFPEEVASIVFDWFQEPFGSNRIGRKLTSYLQDQEVNDEKKIQPQLSLHRQICREMVVACQALTVRMKDYWLLQESHHLRSRQRTTYARLLCCCPLYAQAMKLVLLYPLAYFVSHNKDNEPGRHFHVKVLKCALSFLENVVSLSRDDKNRWLELATSASNLISRFTSDIDSISQ